MYSGRTRSCALPGRRRGCRTFSPPPRLRCGRASTRAAGLPSPRSTRGACPGPRRRRAPGRRRARRAGGRLDTEAARERCIRTRQPSSSSVAGFYPTSGCRGGDGVVRHALAPGHLSGAQPAGRQSLVGEGLAGDPRRTRSGPRAPPGRPARALFPAGLRDLVATLPGEGGTLMRQTAVMLLGPTLAVLLTGCATKDFVREIVSKSEVTLDAKIGEQGKRVDEQAQRIDEQAKTVDAHGKQLDDMGGRFTKLETTVDETGNIARRAGAKADEAAARIDEVNTRVSHLWANRNARQLVETVEVQFAFDRADLSDGAQTTLAALIRELAENPAL